MHRCMHVNAHTYLHTTVLIPMSKVIASKSKIHIYVSNSYIHSYWNVTGFWKTDRIVTLGLFHFIGPANGYTCTQHIRSAFTRLGGLVCFSRASFADPVKFMTETMGSTGALHGRHAWVLSSSQWWKTSLTPFKHVWAYGWHFWDP